MYLLNHNKEELNGVSSGNLYVLLLFHILKLYLKYYFVQDLKSQVKMFFLFSNLTLQHFVKKPSISIAEYIPQTKRHSFLDSSFYVLETFFPVVTQPVRITYNHWIYDQCNCHLIHITLKMYRQRLNQFQQKPVK